MVGSARAHVGVCMSVCRGVGSHHEWCVCTAKGRERTSVGPWPRLFDVPTKGETVALRGFS